MEYDFKNEVTKYNLYVELDNSYLDEEESTTQSEQLSEYIYNNFNKMSEIELKYMINKCISKKDITKIILTYELLHYKPEPKQMALDEFIKEVSSILQRYQGKAGGYSIEDSIWAVHKRDSERYEMEDNEVVFENTLFITSERDEETALFMKRIINRLESISTNFELELQFKKDRKNQVIYIIIWASDKDQVVETVIGL